MKISLIFDPADRRILKALMEQQEEAPLVKDRYWTNVAQPPPKPKVLREELWRAHLMGLLTTQRASGPDSDVMRFLHQSNFPLSLENCKGLDKVDIYSLIQKKVHDAGIGFTTKIPEFAATNWISLQNGGWDKLEEWVRQLYLQREQEPQPAHYELERKAARYMQEYKGFGPKQSRNFWQYLGLTRYEFVIDIRVFKWLNKHQIPLPLSKGCLSYEDYYAFLSDRLREWCIDVDVLPCMLDAAIFSSSEQRG